MMKHLLRKSWKAGVLAFFLYAGSAAGQVTTTYSASGSFIPPAGATSVVVECWGGGGGGGGTALNASYGGGGGGGGYAKSTVTVVPGTSYTVTVGNGGTAGSNSGGTGGTGGTSLFGTSVVVATGGAGGVAGVSGSIYGTGGAGASTGMTGTLTYNGGNGGTAVSTPASGGGGSSAGSASNGNNASGNTAGAAVTGGGTGASGRTTVGAGATGTAPGGGGSGGFRSSATARAGGAGGKGQVKITYTCPATASFPYSENFDGIGTGTSMGCISVSDNNTDGTQWLVSSSQPSSSPNSARILYNSALAMDDWFYLPAFNLTGGTSYRLTFKYNGDGGPSNFGYTESLEVKYGTGASAASMTTTLVNLPSIINSAYITSTVDFTPSANGTYYIGFHGYSAADQDFLLVDDISLDLSPSCLTPIAAATTNISTSGATLNWTAPTTSPGNGYEYYVSTSSTTPAGSTTATGSVSAGTISATTSSLVIGTNYYAWVRNVCSASDVSSWVSLGAFAVPPANDECSGAVPLTVTSGFPSSPTSGSIFGATASTGIPSGTSCNTYSSSEDIWYSIVVPATGKVVLQIHAVGGTTNDDNDYSVQAFTGTCGTLTYLNCDEDGSSDATPNDYMPLLGLTGQTPGATIYLRVRKAASSTQTSFAISAYDTASSVVPVIAAGGNCIANPTVTINAANNNLYRWVPLLDGSGNIVAEIYPAGNSLGIVSSFLNVNSGSVRTTNGGRYYLDRNLTITPASQPTSSVQVRLYVKSSEVTTLGTVDPTVTSLTNLRISKNNDACGNFTGAAAAYLTPTSATYSSGGLLQFSTSSFSSFYLSGGTAALPVQFLDIQAHRGSDRNYVDWRTGSEENLMSFDVERSSDGLVFERLGVIAAKGGDGMYQWIDASIANGVQYYRIKSMSKGGEVSYSKTVRVVTSADMVSIQAYPNPVSEKLTVEISGAQDGMLELVNATGQVLQRITVTSSRTDMQFSALAPGVYWVKYVGASLSKTILVTKQ
jgi:hypothetical protein